MVHFSLILWSLINLRFLFILSLISLFNFGKIKKKTLQKIYRICTSSIWALYPHRKKVAYTWATCHINTSPGKPWGISGPMCQEAEAEYWNPLFHTQVQCPRISDSFTPMALLKMSWTVLDYICSVGSKALLPLCSICCETWNVTSVLPNVRWL